MDVKSYIEMFDDVIPFTFKLTLKPRGVIEKNKAYVSSKNFKGKAFVTSHSTILGEKKEYTPIDNIKVPIEIEIDYPFSHQTVWESKQDTTNKGSRSFVVRILSCDNQRQLGFMSLDITPAGDVKRKYCSYYNQEGTHQIVQAVTYEYNEEEKKLERFEETSYVLRDFTSLEEQSVVIYKTKGTIMGLSVDVQPLRNHAFDSIVWSEDNFKRQEKLFTRYSSPEEVADSNFLSCNMVNYLVNKDFTERKNRIKHIESILANKSPESLSIDYYGFDLMRRELETLKRSEDVFAGFLGTYTGNTVIRINGNEYLFVETESEGCRYFTFVDITNTNAFDIDFYHDRQNGSSYYDAVISSSKAPAFKMANINGNYTLVPIGDALTEDEIKYYNLFTSICNENLENLVDYSTPFGGSTGVPRKLTPKNKKKK